MTKEDKKMTAPIPPVGADGEQSQGTETNDIIPNESSNINRRKGSLDTVSMTELYDTAYPPKTVIIDNLLYAGTYLFAGAPKIGKSFFMAQLSYRVATGTSLWDYPVHQGEVLYLALEDDYARIQKRLYKMFGAEDTEHLHFATQARTLNGGLRSQLEEFVHEHPSTKLIIVDTLQKVREVGGDKFSYGNDYEIVARFKEFSDQHNLCLLVVHHTRKMESEDPYEMISGSNGLLGAADGGFVMQKKKRTEMKATLIAVGRDQQTQELTIEFEDEHCIWRLLKAEMEFRKAPPDPLLEAISKLLTPLTPVWRGTSSELLAQLQGEKKLPHHLTQHLNANVDRLFNEYGIAYENGRNRIERFILLTLAKTASRR